MSVEKQLADWLENPQFPSGLPSELEEALLVFRPDLAPPPRIDIDELWEEALEIRETVMDETKDLVTEIFAQESVGTVPISIDDILDSVTTGPLAAREAVDQLSDDDNLKEDGPSNDNVIPFRRWATSPLVYGGLAAAMALFILLPTRYNSPPLSSESSFVLADRLPRSDTEPTLSPKDVELSTAKSALEDLEELAEQAEPKRKARARSAPMEPQLLGKSEEGASSSMSVDAVPAGQMGAVPPPEAVPRSPSPEFAPEPLAAAAPPSDLEVANALDVPEETEAMPVASMEAEPAIPPEARLDAPTTAESEGLLDEGMALEVYEEAQAAEVEKPPLMGGSATELTAEQVSLRNQVSCGLQSPYSQEETAAVETALNLSEAERLQQIDVLLSSASADEMITLTIMAFDVWEPQDAVSRLERALRVNGASTEYRCAGYSHLGRFYDHQGDWVKADGYYRQALQP